MPYPDFYNQNGFRSFPLVFPASGKSVIQAYPEVLLDNGLIRDVGFQLGSAVQFDPTAHAMALTSLSVQPGSSSERAVHLTFESIALEEGGSHPGVKFEFDRADVQQDLELQRVTSSYGSAYCVTGNLNNIPDGDYQGFDPIEVEPLLVSAQHGLSVTSIKIANVRPRNYYSPDHDPCDTPVVPDLDDRATVEILGSSELEMTGLITLKEGFNTELRLNENLVALAAQAGIGLGYPVYDDPDHPLYRAFAAFKCSDLIYTINGVAPAESGIFSISGGRRVGISAGTDGLAIQAAVLGSDCEE